ncbi:AraC family transcriptional regulator [Gracilibacillus caseinilyticus]|uniref:AraC family transcriptional regulator n=1 Tax=Gracilibacillus caseinilyticus TaxID=2932256 RepID=A0ABY4EWT0_9BACI|nr:helix-turn-helix domain-containing protein [Gracilibacillus caseinilyticus]UOQ46631.1 AraC family transcriptional regulator [Gracilibacillus caseinilyticus]
MEYSTKPYMQPHFYYDSKNYQERLKVYKGIAFLYYQFTLDNDAEHLAAVPDGCLDVLVALNQRKPSMLVYGSLLLSKFVPMQAGISYFGVRLPPGCGIDMRHVKMKEYVENVMDLAVILPNGAEVAERMLDKSLFDERITIFEKYIGEVITSQHSSEPLTDYLLQEIIRYHGGKSIRQLAQDTQYSERYIRNKVMDRLGISPKGFSKIVRFQHALMMLKQGYEMEDIVFENHYYDQAHLIHEFEDFAYITPKDYLSYLQQNRKRNAAK